MEGKKNEIAGRTKPVIFVATDSPAVNTGFGKVCRELVTRWAESGKYTIVCMGVNDRGEWHPIRTNPNIIIEPLPYITEDPYGLRRMPELLKQYKPDLVFSLNDIWVWTGDERHPNMNNWFYNHLKAYKPYIPWVGYFPVDANLWEQRWAALANSMDYACTFTDYGRKILSQTRGFDTSHLKIVYHGHDHENFYPIDDKEKQAQRRAMGIPSDYFVITNVNRNQPRKSIPATMYAFEMFHKGYSECKNCGFPISLRVFQECELCGGKEFEKKWEGVEKTMLYLHMNPIDARGYRLPKIQRDLQIKNVMYPIDFDVAKGVPIEELNRIYNMSDVTVNTASAGGYELCVLPGTLITTKEGYKKIEDISVGDEVLTHENRFRGVIKTYEREFNGTIKEIKFNNGTCIKLTDNHPLLIKDGKDFIWRRADEVKMGDYLVVPTNKRRDIKGGEIIDITKHTDLDGFVFNEDKVSLEHSNNPKVNLTQIAADEFGVGYNTMYRYLSGTHSNVAMVEKAQEYKQKVDWEVAKRTWCNRFVKADADFSELVGYFLSEGSTSRSNKNILQFSFHQDETEYHNRVLSIMQNKFGLDGFARKVPGKKLVIITFYNRILATFFRENFGVNSGTKGVADRMWEYMNAKGLLRGYLRGDGCFTRPRNISFSTVSSKLAAQINWLLSEENIYCTIKRQKGRKFKPSSKARDFYAGDISNQRFNQKLINICCNDAKEIEYERGPSDRLVFDDANFFAKVVGIGDIEHKGNVYNFDVEEDHSYCANGIASHNCVAEALACGKPVVATRTTSITEQLENGRGILVPPITIHIYEDACQSPKHLISIPELVKAYIEVYQNQEKYNSPEVIEERIRFAKSRSWGKAADQFMEMFDELLTNRVSISSFIEEEIPTLLLTNMSLSLGSVVSMVPALKAFNKANNASATILVGVKERFYSIVKNLIPEMKVINIDKTWLDDENLQGKRFQITQIEGFAAEREKAGLVLGGDHVPNYIDAFAQGFNLGLSESHIKSIDVVNKADLEKHKDQILGLKKSEEDYVFTFIFDFVSQSEKVDLKAFNSSIALLKRKPNIKTVLLPNRDIDMEFPNIDLEITNNSLEEIFAICSLSDCIVTNIEEFSHLCSFIQKPFVIVNTSKALNHVAKYNTVKDENNESLVYFLNARQSRQNGPYELGQADLFASCVRMFNHLNALKKKGSE